MMTYILMTILSLLWGLSYLGTKVLLETLSPLEIMAVRWTLAFAAFSLLALCRIIRLDYRGKGIHRLLPAVLLQPCAYALLETWGVKLTTSSESSIFIAMIPMMIVVVEWLLFHKRPSRRMLWALAISLTGVVVSVLFAPDFRVGSKLTGYVLLTGAVIVGALYNAVFSEKYGKYFSPVEITYAMAAAGTVWFNLLSLLRGNGLGAYAAVAGDGRMAFAAVFLGVGCSCVAYLIHNVNLSRMKAAVASTIQTNAITVVGVVAGIVLGGDAWGWYTVAGLAMALGGICLASGAGKTDGA